jgi:hypothetical protein
LNIPEYIESRAAEDGIPETDNLDRLNKLIKFGISRIPNERRPGWLFRPMAGGHRSARTFVQPREGCDGQRRIGASRICPRWVVIKRER